jgi:hypothetical protein
MTTWIAERRLLFSKKGDSQRHELVIRIGQPYLLEKGMVNFEFDDGVAGCSVEFVGFDEVGLNETYGADSLQALQLAADVEPILKTFSRKYDFFIPEGDPYFETEGNDGSENT